MDRGQLLLSAKVLGLPLSEPQAVRLIAYSEALLAENERVNLTAITDEGEFVIKHLLDSLAAAVLPEIAGDVADVGTGGGFPGAVIAACRDDCAVTLIDATEKKLAAARAAAQKAGIAVTALHGRAEELGRMPAHRERYDAVTARAVSPLCRLLEYCLPLVKQGGIFVAMKGPEAGNELAEAENALKTLGASLLRQVRYQLPAGSRAQNHGAQQQAAGGERALLLFKKTSPTPEEYPRREKQIRTNPL